MDVKLIKGDDIMEERDKERVIGEEKFFVESVESLYNEIVNKEENVCEESFCFLICG